MMLIVGRYYRVPNYNFPFLLLDLYETSTGINARLRAGGMILHVDVNELQNTAS